MIKRNILFLLLILMSSTVLALPTAKITIKVIDEQGHPIEGAKAGLGFTRLISTGWGTTGHPVRGITDADGLFTGSGEGETYVTYSASKEGYYGSGDEYNFKYNESGMIGLRKWQPWNPTVELVLKEIKQPIALYAVNNGVSNGQNGIILPGVSQFYGYDLIARDWVVPYG